MPTLHATLLARFLEICSIISTFKVWFELLRHRWVHDYIYMIWPTEIEGVQLYVSRACKPNRANE